MNSHEEAFVTAFIAKQKQDRYKELLSNPKRRSKLLDKMNHGLDFNLSLAEVIPSAGREAQHVVRLLRERGALAVCHVIADDTTLDRQDLSLIDAIERATASHFAAVVSCVPGKLAFYKEEDPGEWYVLERRP